MAFRIQGNRYEYIYLSPTSGRADDQVRRNHSTVDLEPGVWTKYRIVIEGTKARL